MKGRCLHMLTTEELEVIRRYVDEAFFDVQKLIKYLNMHDIVGNEVFQYCLKPDIPDDRITFSKYLYDKDGYLPLPVSAFVRRIPFYFYTIDQTQALKGNSHSLNDILYFKYSHKSTNAEMDIEEIYNALEYMFYTLELPLNKIFDYWKTQSHGSGKVSFHQWNHYLHLCKGSGNNDYFPGSFITAYNEALEAAGLEPIIYEINDVGCAEAFLRQGSRLEFEGFFPCDKNGKPIMKWIGIKAKNVNNISYKPNPFGRGQLWIEVTPISIIHVLNFFNTDTDKEDCWYQVYAGPKTMQFDYETLKMYRKDLGLTQQQVADAIDTSVRTYQKWEAGETTPDGHFLLRLLNWLDITSIQYITKYTEI